MLLNAGTNHQLLTTYCAHDHASGRTLALHAAAQMRSGSGACWGTDTITSVLAGTNQTWPLASSAPCCSGSVPLLDPFATAASVWHIKSGSADTLLGRVPATEGYAFHHNSPMPALPPKPRC